MIRTQTILRSFGVLFAAFLFAMLLQTHANALTLDVQHTEATCAKDVVFTMSSDGTDQCEYAVNSINRYYPEDGKERVMVVDCSQGTYKMVYSTNNEFSFRFRCSGTYYIRFYVMDKGVSPMETAYRDVTLVIDEKAYPSAEAIAQSVVDQCEDAGCTTDYEKALWLHDWLIRNSAYDSTYSYCSAEAALTKNKGTCESYHRAYEMLLKRANIETSRVTGNGHVWTGVKIDGQWTQIDVTWDDMGDNMIGSFYEHLYFGLTDELMKTAHSEHTADPSRLCTTLDNNYFIRSGSVSQWTGPLIAQLENKSGDTRTAVLNYTAPPSTLNILAPVIARGLSDMYVSDRKITGVSPTVETVSYGSAKASFTVTLGPAYTASTLPADLLSVGEAAFEGTQIEYMIISDGVSSIGSRAFANSALKRIRIPSSVTRIADDAFDGVEDLYIECEAGSTADAFATEKGYSVRR